MKIRTGFVSNSSSSSFVAFIEKDAFEELELDLLEKAIYHFASDEETRFLGKEVVTFGWWSGNVDCFDDTNCHELLQNDGASEEEIEQWEKETADGDPDDWDFCDDLYEGKERFLKKIEELEKQGKAIIAEMDC